MTTALTRRHLPTAAMQAILGSLGGALTVAGRVGGGTETALARVARTAFMSGNKLSLAVGSGIPAGRPTS